ncbi:MAG TPA: peptidylprolyl isomerase [Gammaproteobacteria bacterium]|nr:peptidylprolyl isomerase [Gammaproteobacteria bacterium]
MQIEENRVATLNYILKDDQGNVIDSAEDGSFAYLHGAANIIPGLEQALLGKSAGDEFSISIEPAQGYGERNDNMTQVVPRNMFESDEEIEIGMQFHAEGPDGNPLAVTVTQVTDDEITVDGNHPLAGVNLNFEIKVVEIREASKEELEHGHVHGAGGHPH